MRVREDGLSSSKPEMCPPKALADYVEEHGLNAIEYVQCILAHIHIFISIYIYMYMFSYLPCRLISRQGLIDPTASLINQNQQKRLDIIRKPPPLQLFVVVTNHLPNPSSGLPHHKGKRKPPTSLSGEAHAPARAASRSLGRATRRPAGR